MSSSQPRWLRSEAAFYLHGDGDESVLGGEKPGAGATSTATGTAFGRFADAVSYASGVVAGVCVVAILLVVCAEVVLRQFRQSMLVTDEIAGYLNAAAVFLGLAYTLRSGGFIRVEVVYDALPRQMRRAAAWVFTTIATLFTGVILYYAIQHVAYAFVQDTRAVSVLGTPEWIPQSVMVVGLLVLALQLVAFLIDRVRNVP
jgi:TRAP-type C4-dicarboxylate transport system permease small subunit